MRRTSVCVAMLIALSCGGESPTGTPNPPTNLDDAVRVWEAYGIRDYIIDEAIVCECLPPTNWTTEVRDGIVQGPHGWTVEEMFDRIRTAQGQAYSVTATYDALHGYPTRVFIDWSEHWVDDEIASFMSQLRPVRR